MDDYSVHLLPEIRQALLKKGYVLVGIGGGITGDVQINETDMHAPLKSKYRELEAELMIEQWYNQIQIKFHNQAKMT